MEVGRTSDGLTLSGFGSGVAEDNYEGRGSSPSLTPFLALLSRDERLGWTTSRSRADDTDSLNVNVSECGSCHLSEVSSVSSWLNDTSAVDDDYSSCAPDDETGSEKDDVDEDEDDDGPEIRSLFLLERCLEEKLLERQQNTDLLYPGAVSDCAVAATVNELTTPKSDTVEAETGTMKRASRNLCTFKSFEITDISVPVEGPNVTDTNNVTSAFSQSLPLRRSSSRCNPDSLICTGAIYDFNSSLAVGDIKCVNSELVNGNGSNAADNVQHKVPVQPPQHMHKLYSNDQGVAGLPSEVLSLKNTSPVKNAETPLFLTAASKCNFTDKSAVDNKLADRGLEQNLPAVGLQRMHIANGSACSKQSNLIPLPAFNKTAVADDNLDGTSVTANHISCQSTPLMEFRHNSPSSVKCRHQDMSQSNALSDKSSTAVSLKNSEIKISGDAGAENIDAASVVSDEAEKASDPAGSLGMPMVEDGLSNSDISDVDEAFSMFAGLKPPDPVPVDTSFGAKSPVAGDSKLTKDLDSSAPDSHSISSL